MWKYVPENSCKMENEWKRMMMKECGCNSNFFLLSFNVRSGNYSQLSRPINKSSSFKMPNMAVRIDPTKLKVVCMSHNWMRNLIWRRWLAKKYFFLLSFNVRSGQSTWNQPGLGVVLDVSFLNDPFFLSMDRWKSQMWWNLGHVLFVIYLQVRCVLERGVIKINKNQFNEK